MPNRYTVLTFPSYLGPERGFRFLTVALVVAFFIRLFYASETRVVDNQSGEHIKVF